MLKKNPLWSFFSSVKLAIAVLALITMASILGTLIPQREAAGPFISRLSPGMADLMHSLQLFNIFQSAWFIFLMGLLALNLIVCSLGRFPAAWRRFRHEPEPDREDLFRDIPSDQVVFRQADLLEETDRLERLLRKKTGRVRRGDADGRSFLYGEKGAYSHLGVYLIHFSILFVMAGFVVGFLYGFEGHMDIPEGESSDVVVLKGGRESKKIAITVRCDRFFIDFYENGAPRTYRSDLTFLDNGRPLQSASVLVNHPVTFAGMRFYQARYGTIPVGDPLLTVRKDNKKIGDMKVAVGMAFDLPGNGASVQITRVEENLMGMGPAVKIDIRSAAGSLQFWVFEAIEQIVQANPGLLEQVPLFNPGLFRPYRFSLRQADMRHYTGLQVARDPGIPVVALGALLMMTGFIVVFFCSHRQIWIRLERVGDQTRIRIAGKCSRDDVGLKREIRKWTDLMTANGESAR